jgi:hypothetical protein
MYVDPGYSGFSRKGAPVPWQSGQGSVWAALSTELPAFRKVDKFILLGQNLLKSFNDVIHVLMGLGRPHDFGRHEKAFKGFRIRAEPLLVGRRPVIPRAFDRTAAIAVDDLLLKKRLEVKGLDVADVEFQAFRIQGLDK